MRLFNSIALLLVFLIYQAGFVGLYWVGSTHIDNYWQSKTNFTGLERTISIPLEMPYAPNQTEFHLTDGSYSIDGVDYRITRQRFANDTLHLVLVQDILKQNLDQSINDWIKSSTTDNPENSKENSRILTNIVKDYWLSSNDSDTRRVIEIASKSYFIKEASLYSRFVETNTPPPRTV